MSDSEKKEHDSLMSDIREKIGQPGKEEIIGWSINDLRDNPSTGKQMDRVMELRDKNNTQ